MTGVAPPRRIVLSLYNSDGRSAPIWEKPRLEDLEDFARSHLRGHFPPGHDDMILYTHKSKGPPLNQREYSKLFYKSIDNGTRFPLIDVEARPFKDTPKGSAKRTAVIKRVAYEVTQDATWHANHDVESKQRRRAADAPLAADSGSEDDEKKSSKRKHNDDDDDDEADMSDEDGEVQGSKKVPRISGKPASGKKDLKAPVNPVCVVQ